MLARKTSLIIGGNGALGRSMVKNFKANSWKVVSVDPSSNSEADANILVNTDLSMKDQVAGIFDATRKEASSYDAIICVAGGFQMSSIKDKDIFSKYEDIDKKCFQSALLAGNIASHMLADNGLLLFTGAAAVFEGPVNFAYGYAISKSATHALALNMATREDIPESSSVITILPQVIDTEQNRADMPDADFSTWAPPDKIASLVRGWAEGDNRPVNGAFARLEYANESVFPKFL